MMKRLPCITIPKALILFLACMACAFAARAQESEKEVVTTEVLYDGSKQPKASEDPVEMPEKMPQFPGGDQALYEFVSKNLAYPKEAKKKGIEGTVHIQYVVGKEGQISDAKILKDIGGGCGKEALRVAQMLPAWKPGETAGRPVPVIVRMPIRFVLTAEKKK